MKTKDSAIQWIEVNIERIVKECGGDIGPTSRHRYAQHIFDGISHMYSDVVQKEWEEASHALNANP